MDHKKKLKQQYKETPKIMGVYRVLNKNTGRALLECNRDVQVKLNRHMSELRFGSHNNKQLQNDWNSLGADAFSFDVVEVLPPLDKPDYDPEDDLNELLELTLQKQEYAKDNLYNKSKTR